MRRIKIKGQKVKAKPLPIEVDVDEYVALLYKMKYMHHKIAVMLAFESGLRISEVVNLKPEDFDIPNGQIRVNMGKNSKDRVVALPLSWQDHHIKYIPLKCRQRALQKAFISAAELTGLKKKKLKVHFHSLRHGHATESVRSDIKLSNIQGSLGHSDLAVTTIYINLCPAERVKEYREKFGKRSRR